MKVLLSLTPGETSAVQFESVCPLAVGGPDAAVNLADYFTSLSTRNNTATVLIQVGAVQATGSVIFSGAPSNNETVTIGNVVFTAKTSGATGNQFNISGSTVTATNLAAAINASASMAGICTASIVVAGTVILTAVVAGLSGNALALSEALSNATATAFSGGTAGTQTTLSLT